MEVMIFELEMASSLCTRWFLMLELSRKVVLKKLIGEC